jgi:hypothetical protein
MVANKNRPWTEEDDRRLIEFRAAGRSALSMAVALRRSASAVKGRLIRQNRNLDRRECIDYRENAIGNEDGTVEWRGFVFDGWAHVRGG